MLDLCGSMRQVHTSRLSLSHGAFQVMHLLACDRLPVSASAAACRGPAPALEQQPLALQQGVRPADKQQQQQPQTSRWPAS